MKFWQKFVGEIKEFFGCDAMDFNSAPSVDDDFLKKVSEGNNTISEHVKTTGVLITALGVVGLVVCAVANFCSLCDTEDMFNFSLGAVGFGVCAAISGELQRDDSCELSESTNNSK